MSFNNYLLKLVEDHRICQDNIYYLWGNYYSQAKKNLIIPESVIDIGYHACGYMRSAYGSGDIPIHDFVIIGTKGSEAERYANDNGFRFDAISK